MKAPLLREADAAEQLGLEPEGMRSLRRAGKIPFVRVGTRAVRYCQDDLDEYIEARRVPATVVPIARGRRS